ncbi:MAG TPA: cation:proton antiporter [Polyangiaceae bacterium]|nr:cation:proton antiporter [Polyangiaceae bacterium]
MHAALVHVITSLAIVVGAAALTALVFQALRLPVVLGYILTGLLIGPHLSALVTDTTLIGTLSELGVVLLFFTIGLEFSVRTIARVGIATLLTVVVELSLIATVMLGLGRLLGWTSTEAVFVALGVAIASTMLVVKALEEHAVEPSAKELILAMMVVEDLLSVLLLAILTGVASGSGLSARDLLLTVAKLGGFLVGMVVLGMLVVPRGVRYVARFGRTDTLVVTSLATCFAFVCIALRAGYSVALGAFVAGSLIAESGEGRRVDHLVKPFRDVFAAIFFVSIGMTIVPADVAGQWLAAVIVAVVLVLAKTTGVSLAAFLTGNGLRRSIQAGLALSQVGELSFIAVGIGIAAGPNVARSFLLPVVVGASCITAMTGTLQVKEGGRIATWIDHKLPTSVATFVSFYDSWISRLRKIERPATVWRRLRRPLLNTLVDAALLVAVVIGAAWARPRVSSWLRQYGVNATAAIVLFIAVALGLGLLFAFGIARHAIRLAHLLAREVIPLLQQERDLGRAPRRAFEMALELVALLVVGLPIAAITQPFVPGGALVVLAALAVVAFLARRSIADLDEHVRAGAELIVEVLARQGSIAPASREPLAEVSALMPGLDAVSVVLLKGSPAIGKSLAQLDLRAKTGASVLAIRREGGSAANPSPHEALREGDVLALAGSADAFEAARAMLLGGPESQTRSEPAA